MKRRMIVSVAIELDAERPSGIDAAAMEALAKLNCDFAIDCNENGAFGAKIVEKKIDCHDEHKLFDIILETAGLTEHEFLKSRSRHAARARHLFAYYARKYLEWSWHQIAYVIGRDHSTAIDGVQGLVKLIANGTGKQNEQAKRAREDMERIQRKWSEVKR